MGRPNLNGFRLAFAGDGAHQRACVKAQKNCVNLFVFFSASHQMAQLLAWLTDARRGKSGRFFPKKGMDYSIQVCYDASSNRHSPIAQLVEQLTVNQLVTGSSPVRGAIFFANKTMAYCANSRGCELRWPYRVRC